MGVLKGDTCGGDSKNEGIGCRSGMQVGENIPSIHPSFFDFQVHLLVHLVDEVAIVGPMHC